MGAIAKMSNVISVIGQDGFPPFEILHSLAVETWIGPFSVVIPNGTALQALTIIGIQGLSVVKAFAITADENITVTYAGNTTGHALNAGGFHAFCGTDIASITISNNSGVAARISYAIAGT